MSFEVLREKIITEIPISELIERYGIILNPSSSGYIGICPFHDDTKPSMHVSNEKKIYKCFSCGAGHTHFDFVMELNSFEFLDALRDIADKFNFDFDSYTYKKDRSERDIYAAKILKSASEIYFNTGKKNFPEHFLKFIKERKLNNEIVENYRLGFAAKGNILLKYIRDLPDQKRGLILKIAIEIGLIKVNDRNKSYYDTFRDRIMFPIWDNFGKVIGFQSRAIFDYQKQKYLNSSDSFMFKKNLLLYGLHLAKPFIKKRDCVFITEGNMDQITMFRKGFENTVAIMGANGFSDSTLSIIKSLTNNVYLALDSDNAGFICAEKISNKLLEFGIIAKYLSFHPYKDPDEFLLEKDSLALQERIENSQGFVDVQFEKLSEKILSKNLEKTLLSDKLNLLRKGFEILSPLGKNLEAIERIIKWAKRIGLESSNEKIIESYEEFLLNKKDNSIKKSTQWVKKIKDESNLALLKQDNEIENESIERTFEISHVEQALIQSVIKCPALLEYEELTDLLDFVTSNEVKQYVYEIKELFFEVDQKEFLKFALKEAEKFDFEGIIQELIGKSQDISLNEEKAKKLLNDLRITLGKKNLKDKKEKLKRREKNCNTLEEQQLIFKEMYYIQQELYNLSK